MPFKPKFTAMSVTGGFAVAVYEQPTGQIYSTEERCLQEIEAIKAEQAAKKKAAKNKPKAL